MAATFALHLDHDGVALRRLAPDAEAPALATAGLDDPDFDAVVARMHATVADESGGAAPVLVVLPDSQILYTDVPASGLDREADEGRVRNALVGATPYDLSELVYDWRESGGVLWIAVIAQETLDEARDFVEAHGFAPAGFLGDSAGGGFPGRPRFPGRASDALTEVPLAATPPGPAEPALASADGELPREEPTSDAPSPEEPVPAEPAPQEGAASPAATAVPAVTEKPQPTFSSIRRADQPPPTDLSAVAQTETASAPDDIPAPPPVEARTTATETQAAPPSPAAAPPLSAPRPGGTPPAPRVTPVETGDRADGPAASLSPSPAAGKAAPGSSLARLAGAALGAVRRKPRAESKADPAAGRPESPPPPARAGSADRPAGVPEAPVLRGAKAPKASPAAPSPGIAPPRGSAPAAPAAPAAASRPAPRGIRRIERKAEGTLPAPTGPAPSQAERLDEADSLTVFGARRMRAEGEPRSGGRVLGLTLTFVLLGLMGLVALWSLWFDGDGSPETVAEAPASALAPSVTPLDSGAPEGRQAAVPQPLPDAPAPDRAVSGSARPADDAVEPDPGTGEAIASAEPPESPAPEAAPGGEAAEAAPAASPEADPGPSALPAEPEIAALSPDAAPPTAPETSEPGATGPADGLVVVPNPLDPEAAEAAYAVTGIWQRAPDRGAIPRVVPRPDVTVASVDPSGLALAPPEPPAGAPRVAAPALPAAPLPPGTVLDDEGFVVPTAEGALAPGGYTVFEGQPDILPPRRPGSPTTEEDAAAPAEEAADRSDAPPDPLSDARPLPRPEDAPLVEAPAETPAPDAPEAGAALALEPDIRPRSRPGLQAEAETPDEAPAGAAGPGPAVETADAPAEETGAEEPAEQTAEQTGDAAPGPAPSVRPAPRPEALATEAERLLRQEESAEQVAREEAEAAARALAEAEIAAASRLAVEAAPGPRSRPANMAQIAANARARNAAAQERQATARAAATPQRAEAPAQTASAAAVAPAPQQARGPAVARNQRVAPDVPSNTLVARQATERNALRMNAVTLIGVYGSAGQRRALVRLPSGRYVKVQVGDRLDGGQVAAIDRDALRYVKSGRNHVIQMPSS